MEDLHIIYAINEEVTISKKPHSNFKNEATNLTLVGLKDEEGKIALYIYDGNSYTLFKEDHLFVLSFLSYCND